jgi:hypothetical protein
MASPDPLEHENAAAPLCTAPGCDRSAIRSSTFCRVHLADELRSQGEDIALGKAETRGLLAAAIHLTRLAFKGAPEDIHDAGGPKIGVDVFATVDGRVDPQLPHMVTDMLATHLSDIFGAMSLQAPFEYQGETVVTFRLFVPARSSKQILPRLQSLMGNMLAEVFGPAAVGLVAARPAKGSDA